MNVLPLLIAASLATACASNVPLGLRLARTDVNTARQGPPAWYKAVKIYTRMRLEGLRKVPFLILSGAIRERDAEATACIQASSDIVKLGDSVANATLELLDWNSIESLADSARRVSRDTDNFEQIMEGASLYREVLLRRRTEFDAIISKLEADIGSAVEENAEALRPYRENLAELMKEYRNDADRDASEMETVCKILTEKAEEWE